jgi:hypothetical protein
VNKDVWEWKIGANHSEPKEIRLPGNTFLWRWDVAEEMKRARIKREIKSGRVQ